MNKNIRKMNEQSYWVDKEGCTYIPWKVLGPKCTRPKDLLVWSEGGIIDEYSIPNDLLRPYRDFIQKKREPLTYAIPGSEQFTSNPLLNIQMSESLTLNESSSSSSVFPGKQSGVEKFTKEPQKSKENSDQNRTLLDQHFHSIKEMPSDSNAKGHTDQQLPSTTKKPTSSPIESDEDEYVDPAAYVSETYGDLMENLYKPQPPKWTYGPIQKFKRNYMTNEPKPKKSSPSGKCDPALAIQL